MANNSLKIALQEIAEGKTNTTLGGYTAWYERWDIIRPAFLNHQPRVVGSRFPLSGPKAR